MLHFLRNIFILIMYFSRAINMLWAAGFFSALLVGIDDFFSCKCWAMNYRKPRKIVKEGCFHHQQSCIHKVTFSVSVDFLWYVLHLLHDHCRLILDLLSWPNAQSFLKKINFKTLSFTCFRSCLHISLCLWSCLNQPVCHSLRPVSSPFFCFQYNFGS